ncbi:MAG: hypothetical protein IJF41_00120 [Clostridia bacterium]|nr:hypothetical protein [Clostridia bacterium]
MATIQELIERYPKDAKLQADVAAVLKDGKVGAMEVLALAKKYDVDISLSDVPKFLEQAKQLGLIK